MGHDTSQKCPEGQRGGQRPELDPFLVTSLFFLSLTWGLLIWKLSKGDTSTIRANLVVTSFIMSPQRKTGKMLYKLKYWVASKTVGQHSNSLFNFSNAGRFPSWNQCCSVGFMGALEHLMAISCTFWSPPAKTQQPASLPHCWMRWTKSTFRQSITSEPINTLDLESGDV